MNKNVKHANIFLYDILTFTVVVLVVFVLFLLYELLLKRLNNKTKQKKWIIVLEKEAEM